MLKIIAYLLGIRVEKTDFGALIKFPIWFTSSIRQKSVESLKKDYEVKYHKPMKIQCGDRWYRLEFNL